MRGSITFKIVPSYRNQQSSCEVTASVAIALSSALCLCQFPLSAVLWFASLACRGLVWWGLIAVDSCVTNCLPDGCVLMLFSPKASIPPDQKARFRHYRTPISQPRYRNPPLHITSLDVQCENVSQSAHRQCCSIIHDL